MSTAPTRTRRRILEKSCMRKVKYYFWFCLHVSIIFGAYISPFIVDWRLVTLGVIIYWVVGNRWKYCPLTKWQFGNSEHSFYWRYLNKFGIKVNDKQADLVAARLIPVILIIAAVVYQVVL